MTSEEKIDYIYETLKKQESRALKAAIFKWGFRIFTLVYLIYFIKVWLPALIGSFTPDISSISWSSLWSDSIREAIDTYLNK